MQPEAKEQLKPGTRVKVTQQIAARDYSMSTEVTGTVVSFEQKTTGSWYAHSKADKLWLDRLLIRKDDGELTTLNLDDYTLVEVQEQEPTEPAATAGAEGEKKNESDLPV